jgi:hypothetical protein
MERLVRHDGESRDTDRLTWSRHRRIFGGQGVRLTPVRRHAAKMTPRSRSAAAGVGVEPTPLMAPMLAKPARPPGAEIQHLRCALRTVSRPAASGKMPSWVYARPGLPSRRAGTEARGLREQRGHAELDPHRSGLQAGTVSLATSKLYTRVVLPPDHAGASVVLSFF